MLANSRKGLPMTRTTKPRLTGGTALLTLAILIPAAALAQSGTLFVEGDRVGIGTATPAEKLEVSGSDGSTSLLIEENSSTTDRRVLLSLNNNGQVGMSFNDLATSTFWLFASRQGNFEFNRAGTGRTEYLFKPNGDAIAVGTWVDGSSRAAKHDLQSVEPAAVLRRVLDLPITEWSYTADPSGARHLGPMAEDFRAVFGLGAYEHGIASLDTSGVALAAIQGLHELVAAKDAEIEELRAGNEELERRLEQVERLVAELESE